MIAADSLHARLKTATHDLHQATEAAFDPERRLTSMALYVDLLDRLWSLHAGVERALGAHGPSLFGLDLEPLRRSPMLALDLEATSGRAPRLAPVASTYPSSFAALGGLYVLEGSTLGGRVLFRRARASLGLADPPGTRFFDGAGSDTGPRWRAFLETLARLPARGDIADQAEAGACATFAAFRDRFAEGSAVEA
jgi:heme oxygenase